MRKLISVSVMAALVLAASSVWATTIPTTNLALWLAADNVNGDDTNPANGAQVSSWVDLSGAGNTLSARTDPADGPTYASAGGPLNKPTVNFDGINDQLGRYAMALTSPQIFMVMKGTVNSTGYMMGMAGGSYFVWKINADGTLGGIERENVNGGYRTITGPSPSTSIVDGYKVLSMYTDVYDGGTHRGYPQWMSAHVQSVGQDVTVTGPVDYAYGTNNTPFPDNVSVPYLGGAGNGNHYYEYTLGGQGEEARFSNMKVAEILIYDSPTGWPMAAADRAAVETYLYGKYMVPEPGTLVMLAAGLVGLLAYAWRKRK